MIGEETETDREYKIKIEQDETTQAYELVRRGYQSQLLSRDEIVQATLIYNSKKQPQHQRMLLILPN